jgi:sigma-B regulation protein RsbU (phosphoserine phosphatase)
LTLAYVIFADRALDPRFILNRPAPALVELEKEAAGSIERVIEKLAAALDIQDVVILRREGNVFVPRYSTRHGEPMNIAADGHIALMLQRSAALPVWFDKPPEWIRRLTAQELQTLDFMRTELLLPLTTADRLTGIVSLGAKRSAAPYSRREIGRIEAIVQKSV